MIAGDHGSSGIGWRGDDQSRQGAQRVPCSSISTDGWNRSAGPRGLDHLASERGQDVPVRRIARPGQCDPVTMIKSGQEAE